MLFRQLSKTPKNSSRTPFQPFLNQRDALGYIIGTKSKNKQKIQATAIFQNLKKSTRQYFFEKQFQKLKRRHNNTIASSEQRDYDIENEVNKCLESLQKNPVSDNFSDVFYMNLRQKMNENLINLHNDKSLSEKQNSAKSKINKYYKMTRISNSSNSKQRTPINENLFNDNARSKLMVTFTNCGKKYDKIKEQKIYNPWKKWYMSNTHEIFPGKTIKVKALQKSLYD